MFNSTKFIGALVVLTLICGIFAGVYLLGRRQDIREEASGTVDGIACPLDVATGDILVMLNGRVKSNAGESGARFGPVAASVPAGRYEVTLVSYDDHSGKPGQNQPAESYYLKLFSSGAEIGQTVPIGDLPNDQNILTQIVETDLDVGSDVTELLVVHPAFPSSSPNSIEAICALFKPSAPPIVAQCLDLKIFDEEWTRLSVSDLAKLESGDIVRFSVSSSSNLGVVEKARFTINGVVGSEVTTKRPGAEEFYYEYTIPDEISGLSIKGEVYHSEIGWF